MNFAGIFIKFDKYEHLLELQKSGILYCGSLLSFAKYEDGNVRGDKWETVVELIYLENQIFQFKPVNEPDSEYNQFP